MINRTINWVTTIGESNDHRIKKLEEQLFKFYSTNPDYYGSIDFTGNNWVDPEEKGYQEIVVNAKKSNAICEVGCGNANLLKHYRELAPHYSGCDFSDEVLKNNKRNFPLAKFSKIDVPNSLPFADKSFDLVFSVFVLEHSTQPSKLLDECARVLKVGGTLIILCPDFMGQRKMTSQRAGYSHGNSSQKLRKGKVIDALITLYDNRIRIPSYCRKLVKESEKSPLFMINLSPVVFEDPFTPDVDAVYVTNRQEIISYLASRFELKKNSAGINDYEQEKALIFLTLTRTSG